MPPSISISEFKTLVAAAFRLHDELHAKSLADSLNATDYGVDELYTPYIPLASRHERAARQQQTQDESLSIFSRGRGSCYLPSFVYSPASDPAAFTSPRPSSFLPSCCSDTDSSPRPRLPLSLKPRQHPSSQDWTLTLDSRSRKRPSISTSHFNIPEEPIRRATTTVPAGESPPSSPLSASDSQESVDSQFTFTSHPYSNLYSLSLAQREDSAARARSPRKKKVSKEPQRKESSASCSKWWLDDDWVFYDEEDEMLYYAASSSLTSFLSFS